MESDTFESLPASASAPPPADTSPLTVTPSSAALRRLMDEVRCEEMTDSLAAVGYNRAHNRHNRS
jgi:hypothetical protein